VQKNNGYFMTDVLNNWAMKRFGYALVSTILIAQSATASPIVGRWQGNFEQKYPMNFLFSPQGKFIMVFGSETNPASLAGVVVDYKIDATQKPMHLDISLPETKEPVLTIAELIDPQTLRIQMKQTNPGKPRPTQFTDQTQMKKVSDRAIEPLDSAKFTDAAKSDEGEGRLVIQALAQSALFSTIESGKFPTTLEQLGLPTNSTANYRYQLQTQPNQITLVARPKKANLKSYISVVAQGTERKLSFISTGVCQSVRSSLFAPPVPRLGSPFGSGSPAVTCGSGSEPVKF
jgi:hypothetical protein